MPYILDPNKAAGTQLNRTQDIESMYQQDYSYEYPEELDLKPGSEQHETIKDYVMRRARDSRSHVSSRFSAWEELDKLLKPHMRPEGVRKARSDERAAKKESLDQLVMPVSYAALETVLTYIVMAFLDRPIFKYEAANPDSMLGAMMMQKVVDLHCVRNNVGLSLHTQWRDSLVYGLGIVSPSWHRKYGGTIRRKDTGFRSAMRNIFVKTGSEREVDTEERRLIFEGNKLINISPYRYLPDPHTSAHDIDEAEFSGYIDSTNYKTLLNRERDDDDYLFNVRYLRHLHGRSSLVYDDRNKDKNKPDRIKEVEGSRPVDVVWMYCDIIPNDLGISSSEYPETWLFGIGGDEVVIGARPLGLVHGSKPMIVASPDYDGYSSTPLGRMEVIGDMQNLVDFLYRSHIQNVRKAVNDMFIVDPYLININDVRDPKPGKIMRKRKAGWGRGTMDEAIKQLQVSDVTQAHIGDASALSDMMQHVSGSTDILQGRVQNRGSRVSATEAGGARMSGLSRLEKAARVISLQSMKRIGYMFASHTQQFMDEDLWVKTTGNWEEKILQDHNVDVRQDMVKVKPADLAIEYDLIEQDGSIPGSEDTGSWQEMFQVIMQSQELSQHFDIPNIFKHIARQAGAKNVDSFVQKAPQIMGDEQTRQEVQRGNLVPTEGEA